MLEGRDIHPRNKQTVANRLRNVYKGLRLRPFPSKPRYRSMEIKGNKVSITLDQVGQVFTVLTPGNRLDSRYAEDQKFVWADAKLIGKDKVDVWSEQIKEPVAVRYAWMNNPVCNLFRKDGAVTLPVTPFRTDNFPMITKGN